jgi:hypothetical protein
MSVEQTSQLIQLILNSALMVTACVITLGGLLVRHAAINDRLRLTHREYFELFSGIGVLKGDRRSQLRQQLRQLRQRYRLAYRSLLAVHSALVCLLSSTFVMALRTLVNWNGLISGGLVLFAIGVGIFLVGAGFALLDFYTAGRSLPENFMGISGSGTSVKKLLPELSEQPSMVQTVSQRGGQKAEGRGQKLTRRDSRSPESE